MPHSARNTTPSKSSMPNQNFRRCQNPSKEVIIIMCEGKTTWAKTVHELTCSCSDVTVIWKCFKEGNYPIKHATSNCHYNVRQIASTDLAPPGFCAPLRKAACTILRCFPCQLQIPQHIRLSYSPRTATPNFRQRTNCCTNCLWTSNLDDLRFVTLRAAVVESSYVNTLDPP